MVNSYSLSPLGAQRARVGCWWIISESLNFRLVQLIREPLFVSLNDNLSPITSGAVNSAVRRVAKALGLGPNVTGHSLRIGGCTAAAAAGIPMEIIRVIGGWFSDAMLGYIRAAAAPALSVTQRMGL